MRQSATVNILFLGWICPSSFLPVCTVCPVIEIPISIHVLSIGAWAAGLYEEHFCPLAVYLNLLYWLLYLSTVQLIFFILRQTHISKAANLFL